MPETSLKSKPLSNLTVLIVCSAKKMSELAAGIEAMGGSALPFPVIEARDIEDKRCLDEAIVSLHKYDWIVFTSAYGVSFFMKRIKELGASAPIHGMPKICAIGPATAAAVRESGSDVALVPRQFVAEGVLEALADYGGGIRALAGKCILIPRAQEAREILPSALAEAGATVDVVPCYQTVRAEPEESTTLRLREKKPDLTIFTSSSCIRSLVDLLGETEGRKLLIQSVVAVIGPITGSTAESFGKRAEIMPEENTIASLLQAISVYYAGRRPAVGSPE